MILFLLLSINLIANELKWVDEQIQAIKPTRDGITKAKINSIDNPFISIKKTDDKKKVSSTNSDKTSPGNTNTDIVVKKDIRLILDAIINNSALINGKWYQLNSKVGKYTLSDINRKSIILRYKNKELFLSTETKNKTLKFKNN